jgi:purine-binding chemotaxis protein CheW
MLDDRNREKTAEEESNAQAQAGLYLTFTLGDETYGLEILRVQEIIGIQPVTAVPKLPGFVRGVINLRGKVIPVVDLRLKFGMPGAEDTNRTCIVVLQVMSEGQEITMGVVVDEVREVSDITADQIEAPPAFGATIDTRFISGMGKLSDRVVMLLDVDRVMSSDEMTMVTQAAQVS